ncbi:hypothetical protein FOZ62_018035, partial [Perkinsus olseni]
GSVPSSGSLMSEATIPPHPSSHENEDLDSLTDKICQRVLSALDDRFGELEKHMRYTAECCMKSSEELRLACPRLADDRSMDEQATMTKREARLLRRQRSSSVSTVGTSSSLHLSGNGSQWWSNSTASIDRTEVLKLQTNSYLDRVLGAAALP